jgi:hypothetical protein
VKAAIFEFYISSTEKRCLLVAILEDEPHIDDWLRENSQRQISGVLRKL